MRIGIISKGEYDSFFKSVNTVAKEFVKDLSNLTHQAIEKEKFLEKYGHLRPGTYDEPKSIQIILRVFRSEQSDSSS